MGNFILILLIQCKGCCVKPDGSPGPCAGDSAKCIGCLPPPALDSKYLINLLLITAVFYGLWVIYNHNKNIKL